MVMYHLIVGIFEQDVCFEDHFAAADFLDSCDRNGTPVIVKGYDIV